MIGSRHTRADPRRRVSALLQQVGPRLPTSLAEAQAAAHIDAELRRIGMSVSVDTFRTLATNGRASPIVSLLSLIAIALGDLLPLPALLLGLWSLIVALGLLTLHIRPLLARRGDSQNVVATRPAEKQPHWRVVLLARLDSLADGGSLRRLGATHGVGPLLRVGACALLVALQALRYATGDSLWWYAQAIPALYLLLLLVVAYMPQRALATTSGIGALAALITAVDRVGVLRSVEVWAVALGASHAGDGLRSFLERYPFPRGETVFIGLDGLDGGRLSFATREGIVPVRYADPYLLNLAGAVDADDPLIDAEPRPARSASTLVAPLLAHGYRAITLMSYDRPSAQPAQNGTHDPLDAIDAKLIDQAARLVVGMVQKLDG